MSANSSNRIPKAFGAKYSLLGVLVGLIIASTGFANTQQQPQSTATSQTTTADIERATPQPKDMDLYLCIGQSNMAGRASYKKYNDPLPGVFLFTDDPNNQWVPASNPLNRYSPILYSKPIQKLSPCYSFAKEIKSRYPNRTIGIVHLARGGTSIDQWIYSWRTRRSLLDKVLPIAQRATKFGTYKAIIWHQGEANPKDSQSAYTKKATKLVTRIRSELGSPNLPFVVGQVVRKPKYQQINDILASLATAIPFTAVASSEGLSVMDAVHFDSQSQITLGKRYAEALIKLETIGNVAIGKTIIKPTH